MIKPFTTVKVTALTDGMRKFDVLVRKHERIPRGVATHELQCAIFVHESDDADEYILEELKKQGWC
jgi:hypothetical protein